jgi:hypothetical protein
MIIGTISYLERKNLGNYEHIEMSANAVLDEGENFDAAMAELRAKIHNALNEKAVEIKQPPKEEEPKEEVKEEKKKVTKKKETVKVEAPKEETVEVKEEVVAEVVVEEVAPKAHKFLAYDRTKKEHTDMLASYLNTTFGATWKTNPHLKDISASLSGKDFLDDSGLIVESFKAILQGHFGTKN